MSEPRPPPPQLDKRCKKLPEGGTLPGEDAFRMYDTFGFPIDLTLLMCEEKGLKVVERSIAPLSARLMWKPFLQRRALPPAD